MKRILFFLVLAASFTACKKETEVSPKPTTSLADKFAGSYNLSSFRYTDAQTNLDLPTLPLTNNGKTITGMVTLTKVTDTKMKMAFILKATGVEDFVQNFNDLEVRQEGSEYGLFAGTTRIADVEGTTVIFNYSETDPNTNETTAMAFVAKR